jgi:2-polyprenyl-3-methyl-5-hydroxy-6-metoxy-1,4-benzoquinol methylase
MSIKLFRHSELSSDQIGELDRAMAAFYRHPPANYYQIADQAAQHYTTDQQPFHCDLIERVFPGASVLEVGCGTAHLCPHIEKKGGRYAGLDYSIELLQENRQRFPQALFYEIGTKLDESFDIVTSLYVLEHVTDPPAYLESLWSYCRPGGLICIICPEFIDNHTITPAVFYGKTPRRFRKKLLTLSFIDAAAHLLDLKIWGPRWRTRARATPPGAFWINLRPSALYTKIFFSDADAVHMTRLKDIVWYYQNKGAQIIQTSSQMPQVALAIRQINLYMLARKP